MGKYDSTYFDGHPEKSFREMIPYQKLEYLSMMIELKYYRDNFVKKKQKDVRLSNRNI